MLQNELIYFCEKIQGRLPELLWKLPYWPKGYLSYIPIHLFESRHDWTPSMAINEISKHLQRLKALDANSAKAQYLCQKIARQIEVLVVVSKLLPSDQKAFLPSKRLTRHDYVEDLQLQYDLLQRQKQAFEETMRESAYADLIAVDYHQVLDRMKQLENLLQKA